MDGRRCVKKGSIISLNLERLRKEQVGKNEDHRYQSDSFLAREFCGVLLLSLTENFNPKEKRRGVDKKKGID